MRQKSRAGNGSELAIPFTLTDFGRAQMEADGWVGFADSRY